MRVCTNIFLYSLSLLLVVPSTAAGDLQPGCNAATGECLSTVFPLPPSMTSCSWDTSASAMVVGWVGPKTANYQWALIGGVNLVEVAISAYPGAPPFAVYQVQGSGVDKFGTTEKNVSVPQLISNTTYHVSLRAHDAAFTSTFWTGAVTWGRYSGTTPCTTGTGTAAAREHRHRAAAPQKMLVVRTSEHSGHTDYLAEHDSSDMMAASYLLTAMSMLEATKGDTVLEASWIGLHLEFAAITAYCVEFLPAPIPGTSTTVGNTTFADYTSCNYDASGLSCSCAIAEDRVDGGFDLSTLSECKRPLAEGANVTQKVKEAHASSSSSTSGDRGDAMLTRRCAPYDPTDCTCTCSSASAASSASYIGYMPVRPSVDPPDHTILGSWFSHPGATECDPSGKLGDPSPYSGKPCTWRRDPMARVIYGNSLFVAGFNTTTTAECSPSASCKPPLQQIRENAGIMASLFQKMPLAAQNFACQ